LRFQIRQLTRADEPFLWEMLYQALYVPEGGEPFQREILSEPQIARYVAGWGRANDLGFAAVQANTEQPIGAAWIRLFNSDDPGYGYVDGDTPELSVAVIPEHRNRGVGAELLCYLIDEASKQHPAVSLSVSVDNPAKRLYQRLGFEIVERNKTSLTMLKRLAAEGASKLDIRSPATSR